MRHFDGRDRSEDWPRPAGPIASFHDPRDRFVVEWWLPPAATGVAGCPASPQEVSPNFEAVGAKAPVSGVSWRLGALRERLQGRRCVIG